MNSIYLKLFFLFSCCFSCSSLFSQAQYLYTQEVAIETEIEGASNGDAFLVTDSFNDTASFLHRIIFERLDGSGNVLQSTGLWKQGGSFRLNKVFGTSDNGALVMGTTAPPLTDEDSVFIIKVGSDANISWTSAFQFLPDIHEVAGAYETTDGDFIIYGLFENSNAFTSSIFLVKISAAGNKIWSREVKSQLTGAFLKIGGIIETGDGDLWLSGSTRFNSEGSWAAKLNESGVLQEVVFYDTHNLTDSQAEPFAMFQRSNGDRDIFYNSTAFLDGSMLLNLRTDADGLPIQTRRYYLPHNKGGDIDFVKPNGAGGYLLSGFHFPTGIRASGLAFELEANDNIKWSKEYGTGYIELLTGIVGGANGGFLLGGFADPDSIIISPSENGLFPWLIVSDANGNTDCYDANISVASRDTTTSSMSYQLAENAGPDVANMEWMNIDLNSVRDSLTCMATGIYGELQTEVKLYPNPSQGWLTVETKIPLRNAKLTIRDLTGKLLWERQEDIFDQISFQIDIPAGVYIFSLEAEGARRRVQKIQVE